MAQVEVGLRPVVGHIDLAVLIGRHRPRIDVQIGIELANPHAKSPRLQQGREACRHQTFAKRSEEHTSELQSLMRISYAVFCLKKKTKKNHINDSQSNH